MELRDRYRGALLGLAVGDALGATLEFKKRGTFVPINDMIGVAGLSSIRDSGQMTPRRHYAWLRVWWSAKGLIRLTK